ncbi:MAG: hypothetical protein AAE977_02920 [Thermoplasmataceae archaeon]
MNIKEAKQNSNAHYKWENHLFAQNPESTIPRTNNSLEQFFRKIRRNIRKRCGDQSVSGERMAILQNC